MASAGSRGSREWPPRRLASLGQAAPVGEGRMRSTSLPRTTSPKRGRSPSRAGTAEDDHRHREGRAGDASDGQPTRAQPWPQRRQNSVKFGPGDEPGESLLPSNVPAITPLSAEHSAGRRSKWPAVAVAGAALLAIGFGAVEIYRWQHAEDSFNDHLGPAPGAPTGAPTTYEHDCGEQEPMRGGAGCRSLYDEATQARTRRHPWASRPAARSL